MHRHLLARLQPDLRAAHRAGVVRAGNRVLVGELPIIDRLHHQQQGHHLGDGRGGQLFVRVLLIEHLHGGLLHQNCRFRGQPQAPRLRGGGLLIPRKDRYTQRKQGRAQRQQAGDHPGTHTIFTTPHLNLAKAWYYCMRLCGRAIRCPRLVCARNVRHA